MHGRIRGVPIGALFSNRRALYLAGVHRDIRRGICGSGIADRGAESVVLSGGHEDDIDLGTTVYYTGMGGRDPKGQQTADQVFVGLNRSLATNVESGIPIRLLAATNGEFEYRGLFDVQDAWNTVGISGWTVCRYRLEAVQSQEHPAVVPLVASGTAPDRRLTTHFTMVRDAGVPAAVKKMYDYRCQICGIRLETVAGPYAEGAHLVPLGGPNGGGADHASNLLCLCPNHHVLLDHGAIAFSDDWTVIDRFGASLGILNVSPEHELNVAFAKAHRAAMGFSK